MREMVLNHVSLRAYDRPTAIKWLKGMVAGMLELVNDGVARDTLRMSQSIYETNSLTNRSSWNDLDEALQGLQGSGAEEEYLFFAQLSTESPLLSEVDQDIKDRDVVLMGRNERRLSPEESLPLSFCADTDAIAVGFPADGWNHDQLTIRFEKMLDDGNIVETPPTIIDNLALAAHARKICIRHQQRQREARRRCRNGVELWEVREQAFPNLVFGPDVGGHIAELGGTDLRMLVDKLAMLDALTAAWRANRAPAPPGWDEAEVKNEGEQVRRMNPELREKRRFRSHRGRPEIFFWHIDFRKDKRIHFRYDDSHAPHKREVEIGYIGDHLPTARFRH